MSAPKAVPIVAIVGRPNVGKSTLFNRYAGHRRALVEDTPGLTRDRIAEEIQVGERRILMVDTAGLDPEAEAGLPGAVQEQAREAVREADAIIFVVDGKSGGLPLDAEIARTLRRTEKPVVLAVNKIDLPSHEDRLTDFYTLGLEQMRPISAEHGRGSWELLEDLVEELPGSETAVGEGEEKLLRVALVGRPNVGKSSLLNRLTGSERVVVSHLPGTTRDAVDIRLDAEGGSLVLVDTAGLRRAARRTRAGERGGALMTVRSLERAQVALVVIDAEQGVTDQDARIAALARERGCATAILANKWDRVSPQPNAAQASDASDRSEARARIGREVSRRLRFMEDAPLLAVSARTGLGLQGILPLVRRLEQNAGRQVPTAALNQWLREAVARHEPAMAQRGPRRRPLKFFYATQTGILPPTFTLFCTDPDEVKDSYRRYLENQLRRTFHFEGSALRLRLRSRRA